MLLGLGRVVAIVQLIITARELSCIALCLMC